MHDCDLFRAPLTCRTSNRSNAGDSANPALTALPELGEPNRTRGIMGDDVHSPCRSNRRTEAEPAALRSAVIAQGAWDQLQAKRAYDDHHEPPEAPVELDKKV